MSWYKDGDRCGSCGTQVVLCASWIGYSGGQSRYEYRCPKCTEMKEVEYTCSICGTQSKYLTSSNFPVANHCLNQSNHPEKESRKYGPAVGKIPSWRLAIDDMEDGELLENKDKIHGMPVKSAGEWKEYYNQPHEIQKQREYEKKKREQARELLG